MTSTLPCAALENASNSSGFVAGASDRHYVTNAGQFKMLTGADYLAGCDFHLTGVVTLVDRERHFVVLQDATTAIALHAELPDSDLLFGQLVSIVGTNCSPYFVRFPNYPFHPSSREVRNTFEGPVGSGGYYLARMRGYLRPQKTGNYSFWIASDNSSELWLSTDSSPSKARKIAWLLRFQWVAPREWSRFPSQRSEPIWLQAGQTYYIEAVHEQTTMEDHLAVAWQGPELTRTIIDGSYLSPCIDGLSVPIANGILREVWTNFMSGDLVDIGGARPFRSALSVETARARVLGPGEFPKPDSISITRPWKEDSNYRWVSDEGVVTFLGVKEQSVWLRLVDDTAEIQVCAPRLNSAFLQRLRNARVRVRGVCEGVYDKTESLRPGVIWVAGESSIDVLEEAKGSIQSAAVDRSDARPTTNTSPVRRGFYSTRGVVTFNDRVAGQDYLVVQDEESAMLLSGGETSAFQKRLKVGEWVELGGAMYPGKDLPVLSPLVIAELGRHCMPSPIMEPVSLPPSANRAGKWSELEGIAHSVDSNGILSIVCEQGPAYFWIGEESAIDLACLVDAKIRVQGVLWPNMLDAPLFLVPSRNFVDIEEPVPADPFEVPKRLVCELALEAANCSLSHRAKVAGEITYQEARSFVLQDGSGGIRVMASDRFTPIIGDTVEVVGFPTLSSSEPVLTDVLIRPAKCRERVQPTALDMSEGCWVRQASTLVVAKGTVLAQKTNDNCSNVLELQDQQRVFAATLPIIAGRMPRIAPGSRVRVVGVCEDETSDGKRSPKRSFGTFNVLLRSPSDVAVLWGPPWWTLKRTVALVSALLAIIAATLLWNHLLRRRLERQRDAQLVFSQHVLGKLEEERHRIAVNLHDSLGHALLVIQNRAVTAAHSAFEEQEFRGHMNQISEISSQAIEEVRHIAQGLRPSQLDRLGLTEAIRASINRASESGSILFASRVDDIDGLFDQDGEIHVFRIVQEAVTNVVKHSSATEAAVVIKRLESEVSLAVRDNGCGFDPAKNSGKTHQIGYGLTGIEDRVRILSGTLTLESRVGVGTRLTIEVPLKSNTLCEH